MAEVTEPEGELANRRAIMIERLLRPSRNNSFPRITWPTP